MGYPQDPYGQRPSGPQQPYGQQPSGPQPYGYGPPSGPYHQQPPPPPKRSNMPLILLLAIGLPLLLLGGCMAVVVVLGDSSQEAVITNPDRRVAQPPAATQEAPAQEQQSAPQEQASAARIGEAITLTGTDPGLKVTVTLTRLIDPATSETSFLKPKAGSKFIAVELTLTNAGQAAYSDSPGNGAVLIDSEGQTWSRTFAQVREGRAFGSVTMSGTDTRKGVLVYEVPESVKLAKFQLGLDSGFAEQKGEWALS